MASLDLAFGKTGYRLELDSETMEPVILEPRDLPALEDPESAFRLAVEAPVGTPPLRSLAKESFARAHREGRMPRVVIVIADHTRPVPDRMLVPWLVEQLEVPDAAVTVLVGTGTHRGSTPTELQRMLGAAAERFRILNHDCEHSPLVRLGETRCGGVCWLNQEWVEADLRLATGFIEPHFYAGFSGGSKAIVPGIAGLETVRHFHRASLIANPSTTWGRLEGNPLQQLTREMTAMCPPHFIVNVTLNRSKHITAIYAGAVREAHDCGARHAFEESVVRVPERFPIVVTSNGGYPHDQNFYQTVKGISAAARIVEPGGSILAISRCEQGLPDEGPFGELLASPLGSAELHEAIRRAPVTQQDQWQVQTLLQCLEKARVYLYSEMAGSARERTRTVSVDDPAQKLRELTRGSAVRVPVAVLPQGPLTIPEWTGAES
jgi:nickel-dependent lactate racemase